MRVGDAVIRVQGVSYVYPDGTEALRNVSLEIREGEYVALIGQNGSGKTTLAKCICGLLKPTEGDVIVYGMNTKNISIHELAVKVGYIFQNPDHQLFNMTVYDEIAYGPRNLKLPEDEVKRRVFEAMKTVGLNESYLEAHPFFLSKGMRQRVAIASILALRPNVIIVDEPTTGQDFKQSIEIMNFLTELNSVGHTIIIITHDMSIVARYARRVVCMSQGEVLLDRPTKEVFSKPDVLKKAFLKPPEITRLAQALGEYGIPPDILSVDELLDEIMRRVRARR